MIVAEDLLTGTVEVDRRAEPLNHSAMLRSMASVIIAGGVALDGLGDHRRRGAPPARGGPTRVDREQ